MEKLFLLFFAGVLFLLTNIAYADISPTQTANILQPQLAAFNALAISGNYHITVTTGKTQHVQINGDAKQLANVQTSVNDNTLNISMAKEDSSNESTINITITMPQLTSLRLSGANTVTISDLAGNAFNLNANGDEQLVLAGKIKDFTINVAGDIKLDATKLIARKAQINAQGNVQIKLYVTDELRTHAMGNVAVSVLGSPKIVSSAMYGNTHVESITH